MQIIDSHTHLDFSEFDTDRDDVLQRASAKGVDKIIISSTVANRWHLIASICNQYNELCFPAYGLHPMFMHEHDLHSSENDLIKLRDWLLQHEANAVGEIGLDFFIEEADEQHRKAQKDLFISQLEIANELNLPVIIHARKSLDIVLKYLRKFPSVTGSIHSFSGSEQQAKQLFDLGFYLSFGGPISYDRATKLHKLVKAIPLDALLIETDSPDQADASHHLQRNEPAFIHNVIEKIAELKGVEKPLIIEKTSKNAINLFNLSPT